MSPTWQEIVASLPRLLSALVRSQAYPIADLTKSKVERLIRETGTRAGVYVFSQKADDKPVYVGRSANLPQRLGLNHRSTLANQAALTKCLMDKLGMPSMEAARERLYADFQVRFLAIDDVYTRAAIEIYAALKLGTEFNDFREH